MTDMEFVVFCHYEQCQVAILVLTFGLLPAVFIEDRPLKAWSGRSEKDRQYVQNGVTYGKTHITKLT